jgi:nitrate/TMAO reductase-like tetraheme cytochrome c subunit
MKAVGKYFALIRKLRFYEILLLVFIAIVLGAWSVKEITESALFCGSSCHIMRPYYEDWKTSAHASVPCVDCHLEPSDEQQFVPQFKAVTQVASYLTRTYGEHRRAEINDTNCLKEECHSRRLLDGRVTFGGNIRFDHTPHLQQLKRGKILRCTTCHSRVAMGKHVTVVNDACFICHFKNGGREAATSDCLLCHNMEENDGSALPDGFDHRPLRERGAPCISCHQTVTRGNGQLKPESCRECHILSMYDALNEPVELLHRVHVTDHKVECTLCHEPIQHSIPDESSAGTLYCGSCHEDKHKGILDMFKGTGAKGIAPLPSPMRKAHVGCSGCHIVPDPAGGMGAAFTGMNMIAIQAACQSCHPSSYSDKVEQWNRDISTALFQAESALQTTESRLSVESYGDTDTRRTMENIRHNILFVQNSAPIHNRDYAVQILEKAILDLSSVTEKTRQR